MHFFLVMKFLMLLYDQQFWGVYQKDVVELAVGGSVLDEATLFSLKKYIQLPKSRFAKLPSPAIVWKIWKALYSHGCSVGCRWSSR